MNKPLHLIKGQIADYHWGSDGILVSYSKNVLRTVDLIQDNIALVKSITGDKKVPLLIFLTQSPVPDKATRKYSQAVLPSVYTAMALVSKPGLAQLVMKMVFALQVPPIPMKSFSNEIAARQWLQQFL